jgi:hypothetical protein
MANKAMDTCNAGECPLCGGRLCIIEAEMNVHMLGSSGVPYNTENLDYKSKCHCMDCHKDYPYEKTGMSFKVHSRGTSLLNKQTRQNNIEAASKNPFGYLDSVEVGQF